MINRYLFLIAISIIACSYSVLGQNADEEKKFGINFGGFVKNDFFYDSRQTIDAREGHLLLFPANISLDPDGVDLNDQSSFHFLSIASRLSGRITAPDAFGAKTSGLIEAEFFGNTNNSINEFRLRHAIVKLNWEKAELMTGQFWHPMFVTESFPGTVSFNTGIGFQPFARSPQIRYSYNLGSVKIMLAAVGERDFGSRDVTNAPNNRQLRNSRIPQLHFQTHYRVKNDDKKMDFIAGVGGGFKSVIPQISTSAGYFTQERLNSISAIAFANLKIHKFSMKFQAVYGENMTDLLFFGGFAVKDTIDPLKAIVNYSAIRNGAVWADFSYSLKSFEVGIFGGYNMNLGTVDDVQIGSGGPFGLAPNIAGLYRVSPRIVWNSGKARIAFETEYTVAQYGSGYDSNAIPQNPVDVGNIRFLVSTYVFF
jgi:hypothetical protein